MPILIFDKTFGLSLQQKEALRPKVDRAISRAREAFRELLEAQRPIRELLSAELVPAIQALCPGPERFLPARLEHRAGDAPSLYVDGAEARLKEGLPFLFRLASELERHVGQDPPFGGVLGPVADALNYRGREGAAARIAEGRKFILDVRLRHELLDVWDCYLLLKEPSMAGHGRIAERALLQCSERASMAVLEDFFDSLESVGEEHSPEEMLPNAEELWRRILRRRDSSFAVLSRGGWYYWDSSSPNRGPALPLAAFALDSEREPEELESVWTIFWIASEDAASVSQWDLAADCLGRALLHIGLQVGRKPQSFRFWENHVRPAVEHLEPIYQRSSADGDPALTELLHFALDATYGLPIAEDSRIIRALRRVGRTIGIEWQFMRMNDVFIGALGADLWEALDADTQRLLLLAEQHWRQSDRVQSDRGLVPIHDWGAAGARYRDAIENELRKKLLTALPGLGTRMVGETLKVLRDDLGPIGRQMIRHRFGPGSTLLDRRFLDRCLEVCGRYLNPAAHSEGLSREQCQDLRHELLDAGLLRELFAAVQPHSPREA